MQATVLSLFGVCLLGGLAELLLPDEGAQGTRQALHFLCGLAVLILLLSPFVRFLGSSAALWPGELQIDEGELTDYEALFENVMVQQYETDLHAGLETLLSQEYGIAAEDTDIDTDYATDGSLLRIRITLRGAAIIHDPEAIEQTLRARFGCLVEVR